MSRSTFTLAVAVVSAAVPMMAQPVEKARVPIRSPNLNLDHVIHAIDQLYLVSFDFVFDGGSLVFSFATSEHGGREDAVVEVLLPMPQSGAAQLIGWSGKPPQAVVVTPHHGLRRFALATQADPEYALFVRLIRKAEIRKPDRNTTAEELHDALKVVRVAVLKGHSPSRWGPDAFPRTFVDDPAEAVEADDLFGF